MQVIADRPEAPSAIRSDLGAIFVSMELSRSTWLITSLSPGGGEKMSKHSVPAGDICTLLTRFSVLKQKAFARTGKSLPIIVIQEAGLDGFWIHRVLQNEGIESHVVDPASIATSRRRRRAKTDRIDGEALLRTLLAYKRGEPRLCGARRSAISTLRSRQSRRRSSSSGAGALTTCPGCREFSARTDRTTPLPGDPRATTSTGIYDRPEVGLSVKQIIGLIDDQGRVFAINRAVRREQERKQREQKREQERIDKRAEHRRKEA